MSDTCKIKRWDILKRELNNFKPEEFLQAMVHDTDAILIDCRTAGEFAHSCLEGAFNMDYLAYDFLDKMDALDPGKTYLVYCRTGRRSVRTCMLMKNGGFEKVYNLDGGLVALREYAPAII
ncbi:MAG: rhodanese-like domain-containing protein [Saprospiraceae bacterium]|nr:rhodanese-like domain-containing protein [Lewinella sp.]